MTTVRDDLPADETEAIAKLSEAPKTKPLDIAPEIAQRIVMLEAAVQAAVSRRDAFHDGLAAGLGIKVGDILGLDTETGSLIVRDA